MINTRFVVSFLLFYTTIDLICIALSAGLPSPVFFSGRLPAPWCRPMRLTAQRATCSTDSAKKEDTAVSSFKSDHAVQPITLTLITPSLAARASASASPVKIA